MSIETKYRPKAAVAADALRAALIAVEDCGAAVELTNIVVRLSDDRTRLCNLFDLDSAQAFQVERLADEIDRLRLENKTLRDTIDRADAVHRAQLREWAQATPRVRSLEDELAYPSNVRGVLDPTLGQTETKAENDE